MTYAPLILRAKSLFAHLLISTTDYPTMIVGYKILRYLVSACKVIDEDSIKETMQTPLYAKALNRHSANILSAFDPSHADAVAPLCKMLSEAGLANNYTAYFLMFCPAMVTDWACVRALEGEGVPVLDALYGIFSAISATDSEKLWRVDAHDFFAEAKRKCPELSLASFDRLFEAIRGYSFADAERIGGSSATSEALDQYAKRSAGKRDLLRDYLHVFPDVGQKPICFRMLSEKNKQSVQVTQDAVQEEQDYFKLAQNVALKALPSAVLTRLLYAKTSDPKVDCTVTLKAFANRMGKAHNPVVLNPAPAFLEAWTCAQPALPPITAVMPSRQIALALAQEYTTLSFYSVTEAHEAPVDTNLFLLFGEPNAKGERPCIADLLDSIDPADGCEAILCIPQQAMINQTNLMESLTSKRLLPWRIVQLPNGLSNSVKKALLFATESKEEDANTQTQLCEVVQVLKVNAPESDVLLGAYVSKDVLYVAQSGLCRGKKLTSLIADQRSTPQSASKPSRKSPEPVPWSPEVILQVAKSCCEDGFRAKVNVKKAPRMEGGKPGTSLFNEIGEADLRAKSEEALMKKVMEVPLKEKYFKIVANDTFEAYRGRSEGLSLKTIWLILREKSRAIRGRDEEARVLFCGENQSLSSLTFGASYDALKKALQSILETEFVPKRYWLFLKMLANRAVKHKIIQINPLEKIWSKVEAEDNRILHKIEENLRDWSFSKQELDRMVIPLLQPVQRNGESVYPFASDSHVLAKLFVLFSLLHKDELCAITFGDIVFLPSGDAQVLVTKYVDENGKIQYYNGGGRHRVLCRKTVLNGLVTHCFSLWKANAMSLLGLSEKDMADVYVFWESAATAKSKIRRLSLKTAGTLYDQLLEASKRKEVDAEQGSSIAVQDGDIVRYVDIGISRKTEFIFSNSLRIWAEAICGCEDGEISANAGTQAKATLDRAYVGWHAAYNQMATAGKLDRFSARYMPLLFPGSAKTSKSTERIGGISWTGNCVPPADKLARLRLEIPLDDKASLQVKVETWYGHRVNATIFEEETE